MLVPGPEGLARRFAEVRLFRKHLFDCAYDRKLDTLQRAFVLEGAIMPRERCEYTWRDDIAPLIPLDVHHAEQTCIGVEVRPQRGVVARPLSVAKRAEQFTDAVDIPPPNDEIDVAVGSGYIANEKVHSPAAEQPVGDASLAQEAVHTLDNGELLSYGGIHSAQYRGASARRRQARD